MQRTLDKLRNGQQVTIVALGDSNTELTWHTQGRLNWVGLLHEALFETYGRNLVMMINAGCCGNTTGRALERLDRDVLRFDPNLVIISFGTNDTGTGPEGIDAFEADMRKLIGQIRAHGDTEILLRTPAPVIALNTPARPAAPGDEWPGTHLGLYARRIVTLAETLRLPVVDHYAFWKQFEPAQSAENPNHLALRMSDAFHPGPVGHLAFYRELAPMFGLPTTFPWEATT